MKLFLIIISILAMLVFAVLFLLYSFQEKMIFFPEKLSADYKFSFPGKFEELNFQTEKNVTINSLLFHSDSSKGLILYFHGNAGCLASWGEVARNFPEYDVLIMDFRGYGKSTGKIGDENQLHSDAQFIYNEMKKKYAEGKIIVYGRSIGSGIASKLASISNPKMLILETPFYNFSDIVNHFYPVLPASLILKYKFENDKYVKQTKCPVYLIHGTNDEIVPYESSQKLSKISGNIKLFTIENGTHNNLSEFEEFHKILAEIL